MPAASQYFGAPSFDDLGVWVGTLMGEAGNQPVKGMAAIMDSAVNRTTNPYFIGRFGPDLTSQFLAQNGGQYNTWMSGDPSRTAAISARDFITSPAFQRDPEAALRSLSDPKLAAKYMDALTAVRGVMGTGDFRGVAGGAMYYANPKNVASSQVATHQSLGMDAPGVLQIGDHQFYGQGANGFYPATEGNNFDFDGAMTRLKMPGSNIPFTGDLAGTGFGQVPGGGSYTDPHTGQIYEGSTGGGPGFDNTFTPGLQPTTTTGLPFGSQSPAEPPPRPQFENDAFNTPSEDTGRGTKPTLLDNLNAQPAYGGVHDPNLGIFPKDADTTGSVSDPNDYTRRITEALMQEYMPGEYGRKTQTTPTWAPEPGAADGWKLETAPDGAKHYTTDMNFGLPDINPGRTGYPYGTGMDFTRPDIAPGNFSDLFTKADRTPGDMSSSVATIADQPGFTSWFSGLRDTADAASKVGLPRLMAESLFGMKVSPEQAQETYDRLLTMPTVAGTEAALEYARNVAGGTASSMPSDMTDREFELAMALAGLGMTGGVAGTGAKGGVAFGSAPLRRSTLAMDDAARSARALEQGWSPETYYHGTGKSFDQFKEGEPFYLGTTRELANDYARPGMTGSETGGNVMPLRIKGNIFDYNNPQHQEAFNRAIDSGAFGTPSAMRREAAEGGFNFYEKPETQNWLKQNGYDGWKFKENIGTEVETPGPFNAIGMFDPRNTRSTFAAFDPANAGNAGLLGSEPIGSGAAAFMAFPNNAGTGTSPYMSYNDQYKLRTGQDYYNPYYEATKAQQTYADGAYDGSGRQVWGGYVQGNDGLWVQPTPGGQTHTLPDIVPNGIPTTGPNYVYGTGMDFGLPDLGNVGAEGKDSAGNPIWGGYVQDRTTGAWTTPDWSLGSTGFGSAPTADANNPNTVGGTTNTTPDWSFGDAGFNMTPEQWKTAFPQEAAKLDTPNWGVGDAGFGNIAPTSTFPNTNLSGSNPEPANFGDFGMGSMTGAPINLGSGTSPGFGDFGMSSTGTTGGFDAGDQGDAVTTGGHTDYMNSARALDAFTAQQQAAAVAQRNATDASIAAAAAQSNAWNPQYNLSNDFNRNIANLNNPFPQPFQSGFL